MISRPDALNALRSERFDVVVAGGGIAGAGVALDAATRGLSVALVERMDYAAGASGRSSKLIDGGLKNLEQFEMGSVRESLLERTLMVALAPHLVHPLPMVVAAFYGARPDRRVGVSLNMYDVLATERLRSDRPSNGVEWAPTRHRVIGGAEVCELVPSLTAREPTAAYLFQDCVADDARLVLTILNQAERFGAVCANRIAALEPAREGTRMLGVRVRGTDGDDEFVLRADHVVNATGAWFPRLLPPGEVEIASRHSARGAHVTVREEDLPMDAGVIVPAAGGRSIFAVPWLGRTLIGSTDVEHNSPLENHHVAPLRSDIDYLLEAANGFFGSALTIEQVTGAYAGVSAFEATRNTNRRPDHSGKAAVHESATGMITITGGRLTTWRRTAKLVVDRLVARHGDRHASCRTQEIPLGAPVDLRELPRVAGIPDSTYQQLAGRYGYAAREILSIASDMTGLQDPIVSGLPDLLAEVVYAARHEQARSLGDLFLRRTRLGLIAGTELGANGLAAERVAQVMGHELGWDEQEILRQRDNWRIEARAEGVVVGA